MAEIKTYGLKLLRAAEPKVNGEMPSDSELKELCRTYRDSCEFSENDPETTEEFCDQEDDPIFQIEERGRKEIKFQTFDYSPATLVKLKGGSIVDGAWNEPTVTPQIHLAIEITTNTGAKFKFPKCRVSAKFNSRLQKKGLSLLDVTLRPLSPAPGVSVVKFEPAND